MQCDFCGGKFENRRELHLHWGEEHEDELNSHQQQKLKKAERKHNEEKERKMKKRRKKAGWAFAGVIGLIFLAFVGPQMVDAVTTSQQQSFDLSGEPAIGAENASVTVVAFEDFKCPYCKQFTTGTFQQLKTEYIETGKVKFYFVNYPLPLGEDS